MEPGTEEVLGASGEPDTAPDKDHPGYQTQRQGSTECCGSSEEGETNSAQRVGEDCTSEGFAEYIGVHWPDEETAFYLAGGTAGTKTGNKVVRPVLGTREKAGCEAKGVKQGPGSKDHEE